MIRKLGLRTRVMNSRQMMSRILFMGRVRWGRTCPARTILFRHSSRYFLRLARAHHLDEDVVHARHLLLHAMDLNGGQ